MVFCDSFSPECHAYQWFGTNPCCFLAAIELSRFRACALLRRPGAIHCRITKWPGVHSTPSKRISRRINASASCFPVVSEKTVALPLDYYQVLGVDTHFLADAILRAYETRVSNPPDEGFSQDALSARQDILTEACHTLADPDLREEYNENLAEDETGTVIVDVPLTKVPGALCLLQEVGEAEVVLQVGRSLLQGRLPKPLQRDVTLAMALAYVELSREAMADTAPSIIQSCELLERSLKLLQEEGDLASPLQEQINGTLKQLNPRCMLELLALPLDKQHQEKREEGLQEIRSILWAVGEGETFPSIPGFSREEFMKMAYSNMTASEQVDLFTATPSNIPAETSEVHVVALAHIKEGFIQRKPFLIQEADALFVQLQQTNELPESFHGDRHLLFAFERGMCALLLGEPDDCCAWLGLYDINSPYHDPSIVEFVTRHSTGSENGDYLPGLCKLLESWLVEAVFPSSRHVDDPKVQLKNYYNDPGVRSYLEKLKRGKSPLAAADAIVQLRTNAGAALDNVKISALEMLHKVFPFGNCKETDDKDTTILKTEEDDSDWKGRSDLCGPPFSQHHTDHGSSSDQGSAELAPLGKDFSVIAVYTGILVGALALCGWMSFFGFRSTMRSPERVTTQSIRAMDAQGLCKNVRMESMSRMDVQLAEHLIRKWQGAKALAFGPNHTLEKLSEVLDGQMLSNWTERVNDVAKKGWYWTYNLKALTIQSITVSTDGTRAIAEVTLDEAATQYDATQPLVLDSYDSIYSTRYEITVIKGIWKIISGTVLHPVTRS